MHFNHYNPAWETYKVQLAIHIDLYPLGERFVLFPVPEMQGKLNRYTDYNNDLMYITSSKGKKVFQFCYVFDQKTSMVGKA